MGDDVRNGILMDPRLHRYFDRYFFSIYRNEDVFTVKAGEFGFPNDAEFAKLDGLVVKFGLDRGLWPHAEFLKFHNRNFEFFQKKNGGQGRAKGIRPSKH
jgi:HNH endonuclease